jgi:hypothetical protein
LATDSEQTHFFRVDFTYLVFKEERKVKIMFKVRLVVATLGLAIILPASVSVFAQAANAAPAAPLPSQILTAKKVFISNASGEFDRTRWSGGPERTYNEFYAAIKNWGHYDLVSTPSDSDLVLQIGFANPIAGFNGSSNYPQINLLLLDPKTHIVLWTLAEDAPLTVGLQKSRNKSFSDAIGRLVGELKALTAAPANAPK